MPKLRLPRGVVFLIEYHLAAGLLGATLVLLRGPGELAIALIGPVIFAALAYPRRIYLGMVPIAIAVSLWVIATLSSDIYASLTTLVMLLMTVLAISEVLFRLSAIRARAEEAQRRRDAVLEAVAFTAEQFLKTPAWRQSIQEVLARLGQATEVSRVYIFENHTGEDGELLTSQRYEWVAPGIVPQIDNPELQGFPWRAGGFARWEETLGRGQLIHGHVRESPASEQEVLASQDIRSIVIVPIFVGQAWWGFMGFDECLAEREWSAAELDVLRAAANTLGAAIQRQRGEEALRQTTQTLQALIQASPVATIAVDPNGHVKMWNPAAERIFGWSEQEVIGRFNPVVPEDRREEFHALIERVLRGEAFTGVEIRRQKKDGSLIDISLSTAPLYDANGQVTGIMGVLVDMTEWKRAEEALRRRAEELATLHATSLDIITPHDLPTLLHTIVERAARLLDAPSGGLYLCDPDRREVRCVVSFNTPSDYTGTVLKYGEGAAGVVAQTGQPLIIEDYRTWPGRAAVFEEGQPFTAVLSAPMTWQGRVIGVIHVLHDTETRRFTQAGLELLTLFADQAAIAVENARLLEAERARAQRQAALVRLSAELIAAVDEADTCQKVVTGLRDTLGYDYLGLFLIEEATGDRVLRASAGWPDAPPDWRIPPGQGLSERPLLDGQLHYTPDVTREPRYIPGLGSGAEVDVPLRVGDKVLGVLVVESRVPNAFGEHDFEVLTAAANQAALAIEKARLLQAERRERQLAEALREVGLELPAKLDLDALLHSIGSRAMELLDATSGGLYLYRPERDVLEWAMIVGPHLTTIGTVLRWGEGLSGRVWETGQPLVVNDYQHWEGRAAVYEGYPWTAVVGAPVRWGDEFLGVLNVLADPPRTFSQADAELLSLLATQAAIAIKNARLFEAAQRRAQEAETLRQAGAVVAATLRQEEAIERILQELEHVVPYDSASVQLLRTGGATALRTGGATALRTGGATALRTGGVTALRTGGATALREGYLEIVGGRGFPDLAAVIGLRFPVPGDNPNTVVVQERRPHILSHAREVHAPFRQEPHSHIQSWLGVPLIVRDQVIGMLAVDSTQPDHFTPDHARLAAAFADQVAIAIENARLFEAEQRRREGAAALLDIAQVASSSLELKQVLKHIARRTAQACRANRCTVFLLDEAGEYLRPVMSQFANGHVDRELWHTFKTAIAERVDTSPLFCDAIRERRPALLDDPARTDLLPARWTQPFGIQKLLAVPLISHDRVIGLMALDHSDARREFTPEQIDLAQTIGGQVAASIENAQLYARMEQLAITDGLTSLYNRRYFYQAMENELPRSQRYGRPCSLLMMDLDDLKKYNDRYGHLAGDDLLRELSDLIRGVLRQADTAARYGGEEFAVILPETDKGQALAVAERLQERVRQHKFIVRGSQQVGRITMSIGVATHPGDAQDVEGLVDAADTALLHAKEGKDRVCVAE